MSRRPPEDLGEPTLFVPRDRFESELTDRIQRGEELQSRAVATRPEFDSVKRDYYTWDEFNETLLRRSFSTELPAKRYHGYVVAMSGGDNPLHVEVERLHEDIDSKVRRLQSLRDQLPLNDTGLPTSAPPRPADRGSTVFIVHGRDGAAKQEVARFIDVIAGQPPVILHEQPNQGRTIIEKFEDYAGEAGFAVILLTGDDEGRLIGETSWRPRARQNVVFELGFFVGRLGRRAVAVLHEPAVELPSDMSGVLYTRLDDSGSWKLDLAKEMRAAELDVDLNKAL